MSNIPAELKYLSSHEWVRVEGEVATVGISDHAQDALGDLVFVEVPEVGAQLSKGAAAAVVESVKAASDVYSPVSGEVVAVNEALAGSPELVNTDPYGEGWLFRLKLSAPQEVEALLAADAYAQAVAEAG